MLRSLPRYQLSTIKEVLFQYLPPKNVEVVGWLKSVRKYKEINFLHIDDGSTLHRLQVVASKDLCTKSLGFNSCVYIKGELVKSVGAKQTFELKAEKLKILSDGVPADYPFVEKGKYLIDDVRSVPQFRSRTREFASLLRIRSQTKKAIQNWYEKEKYFNVDAPILTKNNCEGGAQVLEVQGDSGLVQSHEQNTIAKSSVFEHKVFLTVSAQLHLEALTSGLSRVYTINPTFRGEFGSRFHLHEFYMVEAEEVGLEGEKGFEILLSRIENLIKFVVNEISCESRDDLEFLWSFNKVNLKEIIENILKKPFPRITYSEAIKILKDNQSKLKTQVVDLNREGEIFLTNYFGQIPVFVTHWPAPAKPFYSYIENDIAFCTDLLMPNVGEVVGGGLREYRFDVLKSNLSNLSKNGTFEDLNWYLDLRKWGHAPTGGYGLGLERFLMCITGASNIRDTLPFPRANGQCLC